MTRVYDGETAVAVTVKGPADIVTAADIEAQNLVVRRLRHPIPSHGVQAEEELDATAGTEWRWIVDTQDGTKNFATASPASACPSPWSGKGAWSWVWCMIRCTKSCSWLSTVRRLV
jgi:myo-inositol-1(or 4)-monophosphatase